MTLAGTALALGALTSPALAAGGGGGGGGVAVPGGEIVYNTASITLSTFPVGATPITVSRDGTVIANAVANVDGTGLANLNVAGIAAPEPLDCWTGFTPEILPGDVITIGGAAGTTITAPNFTVERPTQAGSDLIMHGTAADAAGNPMAVEGTLVSKLQRFSTGSKGAQIMTGALSFDAAGTTAFTTRFAGLNAGDMALGLGPAVAEVTTIPPAVDVPGAAAITIAADNPGVPGPVAGCSAPLGRNAVTGATSKTINIANQATALTVSGTVDPNVKAVSLNVGGSVFPATLAGGTWTATINPSNLPEGNLTAAATYTNGTGSFHGVTMTLVKDTVAPAAPTAGIAAGTYDSARNVALSAENGSSIRYTTDGSDPTATSQTANGAIAVTRSETLKAVAVDKAGNVSPVASFDYVINPPQVAAPAPAPAPAPVVVPKLRLESLTLNRSIRLRTARKSGISAIVYAPEGAKVARVRVLRGHKVVETLTSKVSADGILSVRLPHSKKVRRALRRGTYTLQFKVGQDAAHLGTVLTRTVRIR